MRITRVLALLLLFMFCSSCGSSETNGDRVTQSITYRFWTPGSGAPDMTYTESITISGRTMTVVRTGGARVLSGTWHIELKSSEVATIIDMEAKANQPEVTDTVSTNTLYDAPSSSLQVGNKTFQSGMVENQLHLFPDEAATLVTYLEDLMIMYCGNPFTF